MATPKIQQSSRCLFTVLPPEIRVMIYENVVQQLDSLIVAPFITIRELPCEVNKDVAHDLALTRINRQIRQEALPIFYRHIDILINISTEPDRARAYRWVQGVDHAMLNAIQFFALMLGRTCHCVIHISLADLDNPVRANTMLNRYSATGVQARIVEENVLQLQTVGGKRRVMTKETLEKLVRLL